MDYGVTSTAHATFDGRSLSIQFLANGRGLLRKVWRPLKPALARRGSLLLGLGIPPLKLVSFNNCHTVLLRYQYRRFGRRCSASTSHLPKLVSFNNCHATAASASVHRARPSLLGLGLPPSKLLNQRVLNSLDLCGRRRRHLALHLQDLQRFR
jgi:hypothetical protein